MSDVMAHDIDTYLCDKCGVRIGRKHDLDRHMQLHATNKEELKYPCTYLGCEYRALQRSNLKTHTNTHTGERPHKCPQEDCDFDTSDPGTLTKHRKRIHGYNPKAKSGKKTGPSTSTRRTTRQQTRFTPYSASSRPSRSSSASAVSEELSPSSNEPQLPPPQLPPPQLPRAVDACPSSSVLIADEQVQELKNSTLAFETELALKFARADGSHLGTSLVPPCSYLPSTVPFTEPEVSTADYAQLMSLLEQQNFYTFNQPDELVSLSTPQSDIDAEFERFLAQYDDYLAKASSAYNITSQSNPLAVDNTPIPTVLPPFALNTIDDTLASATLFLPPSNTRRQQYQYGSVDNIAHKSYESYNYFTQPMQDTLIRSL